MHILELTTQPQWHKYLHIKHVWHKITRSTACRAILGGGLQFDVSPETQTETKKNCFMSKSKTGWRRAQNACHQHKWVVDQRIKHWIYHHHHHHHHNAHQGLDPLIRSVSKVTRMPQNRIPLKSYYYRPHGRRTIGRPKKRWREQL